ncbi:MAG: DUF1552 domain-containing protein [Planctomycetes bacterium]|nr:DUF1552 domain-containing protein [Planctomycetota bacterium]
MRQKTRRAFMRDLGLSAAATPFVWGLAARGSEATAPRRQRLVILFSPNGVVPWNFWPKEVGEQFTLPEILTPLQPFQKRVLTLHGICNRVRGDGDSHMRGMSCLLTGIELFPGNIQGGSDTPAGWASGISIDHEIGSFLQGREETKTRFASLEFGVVVPPRADPWTRMVYAGPNKPIAPIDDPYQMLRKLYGRLQDQASLSAILDDVQEDLRKVRDVVSAADRRVLEENETFVRELELELRAASQDQTQRQAPELDGDVKNVNDNIPTLSRMQLDLLVNSFVNDFTRVATVQYTNSVGQARMRWLGIDEAHHELSHNADSDTASQEKLTRINQWFCQQLAYLLEKLASTPEPGGEGTLLDNTVVVWTNELGKGNSHTLDNIPFVLAGNGLGFRMGRSLKYDKVPHNRLWLAVAHAFGHRLETFGKPELCGGGPLHDLT